MAVKKTPEMRIAAALERIATVLEKQETDNPLYSIAADMDRIASAWERQIEFLERLTFVPDWERDTEEGRLILRVTHGD